MLLQFSYSHTTCTKNLRITHSLFSFQRSNFVFVTKLLSLATLISYHIQTNFASIFLSFFFLKLNFFACRTVFLGVFLAGIRIYHFQIHNAILFSKKINSVNPLLKLKRFYNHQVPRSKSTLNQRMTEPLSAYYIPLLLLHIYTFISGQPLESRPQHVPLLLSDPRGSVFRTCITLCHCRLTFSLCF